MTTQEQGRRNEHLQRVGVRRAKRSKLGYASRDYFNRGVAAYEKTPGVVPTSKPLTITNYWNASLRQAYGKPNGVQLGGWLDDAVGNLVPGMSIDLNPAKLFQAAQGLMSPKTAEKYATAINRYGVSASYRGVEVTPNRFATAWKYGGIAGAIAEVPMWGWVAGVGGLGLLYFLAKR